MLPMHLIVGFALGFAVTRGAPARAVLAIAGATAIAWGIAVAISVGGDGDSDWPAGLAGGTAVAIANLAVGAILGAGAGSVSGTRREHVR